MNMLEIGNLAYDAGVRSQANLQAAIAIAMAESGGRPDAVGDVALQNGTWGPSLGLWQIRSIKAESGKGSTRDATKLKDPAFNAKSMYSISNGGKNWKPWTTWPMRAAPFMPGAAVVARGVIDGKGVAGPVNDAVGAGVDAVGAVGDGLADVSTAIRSTYAWIGNRDNWLRIAKVTAGFGLVVGGAILVARPQVQQVAGAVASVVPAGKAASVIKGAV